MDPVMVVDDEPDGRRVSPLHRRLIAAAVLLTLASAALLVGTIYVTARNAAADYATRLVRAAADRSLPSRPGSAVEFARSEVLLPGVPTSGVRTDVRFAGFSPPPPTWITFDVAFTDAKGRRLNRSRLLVSMELKAGGWDAVQFMTPPF